ncbi:YslB family protein [Thalassobacillus sp. CUG 92003]|uniref:YslB family protein n=1 Tax=Thalassobacillus sp. CUG 92003 TaxID=2736641 RepID=UPI0015E662A1|nr:YslB family protein [Thalassobacillus sp. CUG 92003]
MKNQSNSLNEQDLQSLVTTGAGFDLLRYYTLPDFLGNEAMFVLYYMGKNMARKFGISHMDDLIRFFQYSGWGELTTVKTKKKESLYEVHGHVIEKRLQQSLVEVDFRLEAGFIAEALQLMDPQHTYECVEEIDKKANKIWITAIKS